jgi:hypothetical protein
VFLFQNVFLFQFMFLFQNVFLFQKVFLFQFMGILSRCRWFGTELSFVGFYSGGFVSHFKEMHLIETHKW